MAIAEFEIHVMYNEKDLRKRSKEGSENVQVVCMRVGGRQRDNGEGGVGRRYSRLVAQRRV